MSDLSDDEFSVLMIAAENQSMMPIGRWERPVESLVAKGYLQRHDKFNNTITPAGRSALQKRERDDVTALKTAAQAVGDAQAKARSSADAAAMMLIEAAKASVAATGDTLQTAVIRWGQQVVQRALELSGE
jgi:hypothetical protein